MADREPTAHRVVVMEENEQPPPLDHKPMGWMRRTADVLVEATKKVVAKVKRRVELRDPDATTSASINTEVNPDLAPVEFELDVSAGADVDLL